jgi:hypothetical protein
MTPPIAPAVKSASTSASSSAPGTVGEGEQDARKHARRPAGRRGHDPSHRGVHLGNRESGCECVGEDRPDRSRGRSVEPGGIAAGESRARGGRPRATVSDGGAHDRESVSRIRSRSSSGGRPLSATSKLKRGCGKGAMSARTVEQVSEGRVRHGVSFPTSGLYRTSASCSWGGGAGCSGVLTSASEGP